MPLDGSRLRQLRLDKSFTQQNLADASQTSKGYLWQLEKSQRLRPSSDMVCRLAKALDTTVEYLLNQEEEATQRDRIFFNEYKNLSDKHKSQVRDLARIIKAYP